MMKFRTAFYCNLKLILLYLVILCHLIEPQIRSDPAAYRFYRFVYLFHMPLFCFVSGLFVHSSSGCLRQLRRLLPVYLLCQGIAVGLGQTSLDRPWWILWYLLSMCFWLSASALLLRFRQRWLILVLGVAAGCLIGLVPWAGRSWSFSRTVVFFPWFWLGVLLKPDIPWHRFRMLSLVGLLLVWLRSPQMDPTVLYHAGPCPPPVRLECYALAGLLGLFVLSWCPRRRFPWTRAGADTMPAYLLHGPVVFLLRPLPCPWLWAAAYLYITHKAVQWRSLYGIIGKEEGPWPDLKICTASTENRSTGFSSP